VDGSEWLRSQLAVDAEQRRLAAASRPAHAAHSDTSLVNFDDDEDYQIDWAAVSPEVDALCRRRKSARRRPAQRTFHHIDVPKRKPFQSIVYKSNLNLPRAPRDLICESSVTVRFPQSFDAFRWPELSRVLSD